MGLYYSQVYIIDLLGMIFPIVRPIEREKRLFFGILLVIFNYHLVRSFSTHYDIVYPIVGKRIKTVFN